MNTYDELKEKIQEHLIANQEEYKEFVKQLKERKNIIQQTQENNFLRSDIEEQFNTRIKQHIAFKAASSLSIPVEPVIITLETIDLKGYLDV